jgi:hypothetical protein
VLNATIKTIHGLKKYFFHFTCGDLSDGIINGCQSEFFCLSVGLLIVAAPTVARFVVLVVSLTATIVTSLASASVLASAMLPTMSATMMLTTALMLASATLVLTTTAATLGLTITAEVWHVFAHRWT